jgi:hypothetical protein
MHANESAKLGQSHPSNKLMNHIAADIPTIYETHFRFESSPALSCGSAVILCHVLLHYVLVERTECVQYVYFQRSIYAADCRAGSVLYQQALCTSFSASRSRLPAHMLGAR